jgi:hypothetical protein
MLIGTLDPVTEQITALQTVGGSRWCCQLVPAGDGMLELIASDLALQCA